MKIEEMTSEKLSKISDNELYTLRLRFIQLFNKWFKNNNKQKVGKLERNSFLDKYRLLLKEMNKKKLTHSVQDIDRALFRKNIYGLNVSSLGDTVKVPDYVSIGGGFVKSPKDADDLDLIVREAEGNRDEGLELKLSRLMQKQIEKECHFVYNETGAHSTYIPLFDLVLRSKNRINRVEVKEDYSKSKEIEKGVKEYYEGLDEWKQDFIYDFAEMAKNLEGKTILDLGCGTGRVMQALINSDYYNYQVDGVDNNDIALDMCKKKGLAVKKLDLEKDKLPYADNFFCNVIGLHILEHLKEPGKIIKEAIRVSNNKVIFISPLGKRLDPTHKQEFIKIEDFKALFDKDAEVKMVDHGDNTAIAVIDITKIKKAKELKPSMMGSFPLPKPTMAGLTESFSVEEVWDWCKDRDIVGEPKSNGFRICLVKDGDKIRILTDGLKDRTKYYPDLFNILKKIPDDFIVDCSMGIERKGKPLPRIKLMTLQADEPKLGEDDVIVCTTFDLPYYKKDLHLESFSERRKLLEQFFNKYLKDSSNFKVSKCVGIKDRSDLEKRFKEFAKLSQSEGIMIKDTKGTWPLDGRWNDVAKIKIEAEIKIIVLKRHDVKGGNYNYTCGLLPGDSDFKNLIEFKSKKYIDLGKCFNTKIKAEPGDILTMGVEEIIPQDDKLNWLGARVLDVDRDRKEPYAALQVIGIAERANILQKAQHKSTECMSCSKPPEYEVLWAEGMAHAWFCKEHFKEWISEENEEHTGGFTDVDYVKEVKDGVAAKKFSENPNPNIRDKLKAEFAKDWVNSPTFAYQVAHDKLPDTPLRGRTDSPKRMWNDKEVDKEFKDTWLEDLNNIPDIEIRATDIGHSSDRVAFVVFRFKDKKNDSKAKDIADSLNKLAGLYCKSDIGTEGRPRICIAGKVKLGDENWEKWWDSLADKIKDVVEKEFAKAEEGNIDYKVGDTGRGILQLHIMGIEEDKISELKKVSAEAVRSRHNPTKLKMLLKGAIGEQGAHLDVRLVRKGDDYFSGGEIFIGNLTGLDKLKKLEKGEKLRFAWKVPRKEQPPQIVRGPTSWMSVGKNKIEIFEPGTPGATTKKWGAMLILDGFNFEMIQADKHAKKLSIKNSKLFGDCVLLMAYVPVGEGERIWMISKLKPGTKEPKHYEFNKFIPIFDISKSKDDHVVCGIVYAPDEVDSQGDTASAEEIRKAAYSFMEEAQKFKLNHKGMDIRAKVLESFLAPVDYEIRKQKIKKGSWILTARVLDEDIWKDIKSGKLTGYSMAGVASSY